MKWRFESSWDASKDMPTGTVATSSHCWVSRWTFMPESLFGSSADSFNAKKAARKLLDGQFDVVSDGANFSQEAVDDFPMHRLRSHDPAAFGHPQESSRQSQVGEVWNPDRSICVAALPALQPQAPCEFLSSTCHLNYFLTFRHFRWADRSTRTRSTIRSSWSSSWRQRSRSRAASWELSIEFSASYRWCRRSFTTSRFTTRSTSSAASSSWKWFRCWKCGRRSCKKAFVCRCRMRARTRWRPTRRLAFSGTFFVAGPRRIQWVLRGFKKDQP